MFKSNTLEGGYPTKFVEKMPPELEVECSICLSILKDPYHPVTCNCGSDFCKTCIKPVYDTTKRCPACRGVFETIAPNVRLKRIIEGKQVFCMYKSDNDDNGCLWTGFLKNFDEHLNSGPAGNVEQCQFHCIICVLCDKPVQRRLFLEHQISHCPKRPYSCEYCKVFSSDYTNVIENHVPRCNLVPVRCLNAGCDERVLRGGLSTHLGVCPETLVCCEFATIGCEDSFPRKNLSSHYDHKMAFHMSLVVAHGSRERQDLKDRVAYLESENGKMNDQLELFSGAVRVSRAEDQYLSRTSSREVTLLREEMETLKQNLFEAEHKCVILSVKVEEFEAAHKNYRTLYYQVNQHTEDLKVSTEHADKKLRNVLESMGELQAEAASMRGKYVTDRQSIENMERKLEELQDLFSVTLSSRLEALPVTIILRDFSKLRVSNDKWSSPPFYLDGYKLCLSAFVNGDPELNITDHLSLYVRLMKGENDSKLSWPFHRTVTLELLHPVSSKKNKTNTIRFDKADAKYTKRVKVQREYNGWGYPLFMKHSELGQFLKGDRELLTVRVS